MVEVAYRDITRTEREPSFGGLVFRTFDSIRTRVRRLLAGILIWFCRAVLEVVDDQGRPVLMPPPPTPGRPEMVVVAPGGRRSVPFRAFVPRSAPPGRYRVRLRYGDARSGWVDLKIA